jgi:hypothetical protein
MPLEIFADVMQQLAGKGRHTYKKKENTTSSILQV